MGTESFINCDCVVITMFGKKRLGAKMQEYLKKELPGIVKKYMTDAGDESLDHVTSEIYRELLGMTSGKNIGIDYIGGQIEKFRNNGIPADIKLNPHANNILDGLGKKHEYLKNITRQAA